MADEQKQEERPARIKRLKRVHVFTAGNFGKKGKWSEEDVAEMARSYDPAIETAKANFDHNDTGPAHGVVPKGGAVASGKKLYLDLDRVSAELSDGIVDGKFFDRSIEIYPEHPITGKPYIKGVAFLGAGAPAVKGMEPLQYTARNGAQYECFSDENGTPFVRLSLDERVDMSDTKTERAPAGDASSKGGDAGATVKMSEAEVQAFQQRISRLEAENARIKAEQRQEKIRSKIEGLLNFTDPETGKRGAKILPKSRGKLEALFASLSNEEAVKFKNDAGSDEEQGQIDLLFSILDDLPIAVAFGEQFPKGSGPQPISEERAADIALRETNAKFSEWSAEADAHYLARFEELKSGKGKPAEVK